MQELNSVWIAFPSVYSSLEEAIQKQSFMHLYEVSHYHRYIISFREHQSIPKGLQESPRWTFIEVDLNEFLSHRKQLNQFKGIYVSNPINEFNPEQRFIDFVEE